MGGIVNKGIVRKDIVENGGKKWVDCLPPQILLSSNKPNLG